MNYRVVALKPLLLLATLICGAALGWFGHSRIVPKPSPLPSTLQSADGAQQAGRSGPSFMADCDSIRAVALETFYAEELPQTFEAKVELLRQYGVQASLSISDRVKFDELTRLLADSAPAELHSWAEVNAELRAPYRNAILNQALRGIVRQDPVGALDIVGKMNSYWLRQEAYQSVFAELSMKLPAEKILDVVLKADLSIFEQRRYMDIAALIAREQPDRVFDIIKKRFPTSQLEDAQLAALKAIAESDFVQAQRLAEGVRGDEIGLKARQVLYLQVLQNGDFVEAERLFARDGPSPEKDNALATLAFDPRGGSPEESIAFIQKYASAGQKAELTNFLYAQWVVSKPETLGEILSSGVRPQDRNEFLNSLAWQVRDAGVFEAAYAGLESPEDQSDFLSQYIGGLSYSDPREAARLFLSKQSEITHTHGIQQIAQHLSKYSVAESLDFAAQIQDESQQREALEGVVDEWFGNDPDAAWAWLAQQQEANPDDVKFNQELQRRAIGALGEDAPLEAVKYVDEIVNVEFQAIARKAILPSLFQEDHEAAIAYIEGAVLADALDSTYQSIARSIRYATPNLALIAAQKIGDGEKSRQISRQIIDNWQSRRSSTYVYQQIEQLEVPAEAKVQLLEMLK